MSKKRKQKTERSRPPIAGTQITGAKHGLADGVIALMLAVLAFVLYANTLGHGYVLDDDLAISLHNNVVRGLGGIPDIFSQPYREQCFGGCLYRPLTLTTFAIEWALAPKSSFVGHLMNVLWYAGTVSLLYLTIRKYVTSYALVIPIVATILFATHPVHTEVVANIKSRDEILSLFFTILSLYLFAGWNKTGDLKAILAAGLAFFAALLSKEGAITSFVIFPLVGWIFFGKTFLKSLKNGAWILIPVLLFLWIRGVVLNGLSEPSVSFMDNPIVRAQGMDFIATAFVVMVKYLMLLVLPLQLSSDYSFNVIPIQSLGSIGSLMGLLLYMAMAVYALFTLPKRYKLGFVALAFLCSMLLYSQMPRVIGTMMAERLLYAPSLWFVLGLTSILAFLFKVKEDTSYPFRWKNLIQTQRVLLLTGAVIALVYSIQTVNRNGDWANNLKLFRTDVIKNPGSVRLNDGYAEELYQSTADTALGKAEIEQRLKISEQHSHKSLSIMPGISAYNNLGNIHFTRKKFEDAVGYYQKVLDIQPEYKIGKRNMINTLVAWAREEGEKNNNAARARELLQRALQYDENNPDVWHLIGISYAVQGDYKDAATAFEKAYSLAPTNENIKRDLARTYSNLGLVDKAEALK